MTRSAPLSAQKAKKFIIPLNFYDMGCIKQYVETYD